MANFKTKYNETVLLNACDKDYVCLGIMWLNKKTCIGRLDLGKLLTRDISCFLPSEVHLLKNTIF